MWSIVISISLLLISAFIQQISSRHLDKDSISQYDKPLLFQSAPLQMDWRTFNRARSNALASKEIKLEARNEDPCCYPKTWQGITYSYPSMQDVEYFQTFYEDTPNQRAALDMVVTLGNSTTPSLKVSQILLMDKTTSNKGVVYQFDKTAKTCQSNEFENMTFDQITMRCIPADAFYAGVFTLGIPLGGGANLPLRSWMWQPQLKDLPDIRYERLVTSDCAPVLGIYRGTIQDKPVLQSDYSFNIQTTIKDPTVFNVPDYCKKGTEKDRMADGLKFKSLGFFDI